MILPLERPVPETDSQNEQEMSSEADSAANGKQSVMRFRLAMLAHHRAVYSVCYRLLRDAHEAEDVTQEAFFKYWQLSGEVRGAKAWLITVARNKCLDRLRANKRFVDADPEVFDQQTEERDPEWHASNNETASKLNQLISELPEPQRSLILLFDIQGMTGAECAEVLGLNINQVKVYLHRARRRLRHAMEGRDD
jgi:RNA polymerase sigma-70 factor (ECF subfamily)